ncbi:thiolase family protein [Rhodoblastus acidophilus]|uniref:Thiolase family protein n=1 Tax=Candidatus Rhodoblastus alkanivorans TaxID=2954117 RepID=A0ABS9Z5S1_9HYPH|nr:thiolase family protein [Candidatus Rhodoblastus alkanivorans]MCI4680266.1 thiolase family protein [Candidatus Rhodoblastus alkanivorans]MCI4682745.1 thiolase family protein [Candidatus Rhodoblastus alkanivorans]MDI4640052.1 thiolase family protein [Rhodoblastus acidophilus]
MTRTVIAGYVRSPFTPAKRGELASVRPDDMAAQVIAGLIKKTGVNPEDIEDLILGCAFPEGEQGLNVARLVSFIAGLPKSLGAVTVNRFCGSSMTSVHMAAGSIAIGAGEAFICAGVESMSRVPMMGFNPMPNPELAAKMPAAYMGMGDTAENVAQQWQVSRKEQEEFALRSQQKAAAAQREGKFVDEIIPIVGRKGTVSLDGCIRPDATLDGLAELKPAFNAEGVVTAGTSSPLTDGASAVFVCTEDYAKKNGLEILAAIKSVAVAGCEPSIMGIGPVGASRKALKRAGLEAKQLDVVELNEAFSSQAIASMRDLGLSADQVNLDGGAIALGHPLGATGARIVGKAAQLLKREKGKYALATQCIGGGQGIATVLEAL